MSNPWDNFDSRNFGHVLSLQTKLCKHIDRQDGQRCLTYLNVLFTHWTRNDFKADEDGCIVCPIDKDTVNQAMRLAKHWIKNK